MTPTTIGLMGLAFALLGLAAGFFLGGLSARKRLRDERMRYEALKNDFDTVSAVNMELLRRQAMKVPPPLEDKNTSQRFLDLYDEAKRCLHRALDRHNATAPRPIVISRDGANILQALTELPPLTFSDDARKDAGLRSWLYRVIEMDIERRKLRRPPAGDEVTALESERELWGAVIKQCA